MTKNMIKTNASWAIPMGALTYFLIKLTMKEMKRIKASPNGKSTKQNINIGSPTTTTKTKMPYLIPKEEMIIDMTTAIAANNMNPKGVFSFLRKNCSFNQPRPSEITVNG